MAMAGFYYARCGQDVVPLNASAELVTVSASGRPYGHGLCHAHDGIVDAKHTHAKVAVGIAAEKGGELLTLPARVDGSGGWHDAGDFGKYTCERSPRGYPGPLQLKAPLTLHPPH